MGSTLLIASSIESMLTSPGHTLQRAPRTLTSVWSSLYTHRPEKLAVPFSTPTLNGTSFWWISLTRSPSEKHGWRVFGGMMGPVQ